MPQKTKKEKKAAEARRLAAVSHITQIEHAPYQAPASSVPQFQFRLASHKTTTGMSISGELAPIAHDLVKTVILAFIAVSFELLLSKIIR